VSPSTSTSFLALWIISAGLRYASASSNHPSSIPGLPLENLNHNAGAGSLAMKILWKKVSTEASEALMESPGVEEVVFPTEAIVEIEMCLRNSAQLLPPSSRKFQEWNVGLLERYEE
jgi:hypothetical protein